MANKRILIRRDITANWQAVNPTLANGEMGIETTPGGKRKTQLYPHVHPGGLAGISLPIQ